MKNSGFLLLLLFIAITTFKSTAKEQKLVYQIDIKKEIDNTTRLYLRNGLEEAKSLGADAVLLHMNTYGGLLEAADSMRTAILYNPVPVYVFIDNNAASAGALISIACKKIFMRKGANIGAATVVNQTGAALPDKYQSYMRSMIRSTAEAHGKDTIIQGTDTTYRWKRNPLIAEAMVDERVIVPNLIDSGKVLTFTADEALEWGYCDGIAETPGEVITKYLGYNDYELKTYEPSWYDDLKGFLMNPMLQSLLIITLPEGRSTVKAVPSFPISGVNEGEEWASSRSLWSATFRNIPFVPILLDNQIISTKPSPNPIRTVNAASPISLEETASKLKSVLFSRLSVNPATRKMMPLMPAIPNPGMINISAAINSSPMIKTSISQFCASPSIYKGAK